VANVDLVGRQLDFVVEQRQQMVEYMVEGFLVGLFDLERDHDRQDFGMELVELSQETPRLVVADLEEEHIVDVQEEGPADAVGFDSNQVDQVDSRADMNDLQIENSDEHLDHLGVDNNSGYYSAAVDFGLVPVVEIDIGLDG
jgi:hypothetical protein